MHLVKIKFICSKIELDLIILKNFCSVKADVKGIKRQALEWGTVFANHRFDKEVLSKAFNRLSKLNAKK